MVYPFDVALNLGFFQLTISMVIYAVVIVLIGLILGNLLGKLVMKLFREVEFDKVVQKATGITFSLARGISLFVKYFIYFIAFVMALNTLNVTTLVLNMLAGAVILVVLVIFVLAIKDFVPNLIAGFTIKSKKWYKVGDHIIVGDIQGKVTELTLIETRISTPKGEKILIPNSKMIKSIVRKKH